MKISYIKNNNNFFDNKHMKYNSPNLSVLEAFSVSGIPIRLSGGQGTSYLVDNIVLKPISNEIEANWIADIYNNLNNNKFRVAKPILSKNNSWVFDKWTAHTFVKGKHLKGKHLEIIELSKIFHEALSEIPKPTFLENNNNAWAIADKIAWEELPIPNNKLTDKALKKIFDNLRKITLPSQIIHGDIGGNILFDNKLMPAVIDFSPYWRPANFATAIAIIDELVWQNAHESIIDLCKDIKDFDQLLLRALLRRICEFIGHQKNNNKDYSEDIIKHLNIIDTVIKKLSKTI